MLDSHGQVSLELDSDGQVSLVLDSDGQVSLVLDSHGQVSLELDSDGQVSLALDSDGQVRGRGPNRTMNYNSMVHTVTRMDEHFNITGRSRNNWRNDHLGVILAIYCFDVCHIVGRLFYHILTAHGSY